MLRAQMNELVRDPRIVVPAKLVKTCKGVKYSRHASYLMIERSASDL